LDSNIKNASARGKHIWILARGLTYALAALLVLELALRLALGLGAPVLYVTDPDFGYFPQSNQHLHRFFVHIDTNRFGMRSPDIDRRKAEGEYRILFVGDSVPFGTTYVDQSDIFVERIGRSLKSDVKSHFSVLNASAPGWAPENEFAFLKVKGTFSADMVVLVYNTKDLTQPFAQYVDSPLYPVRNPVLAVGELWSRYLKPRMITSIDLVDPGSTNQDDRPSTGDRQQVAATIANTAVLVALQHARFVILFCPAVTKDILQHQPEWDAALLSLKTWAQLNSVAVIDTTRVLSSRDPASIYFDGIHLRPAGDQLVAATFLSWLRDQHE
jgi:hypothetical protein